MSQPRSSAGGDGRRRRAAGSRAAGATGGAQRRPPAAASIRTDPARRAALRALGAVRTSDAYANLALPAILSQEGVRGRDAAFATELVYGTLRYQGRYDAIIACCLRDRRVEDVDARVLDLLRLGTHQLLGMRVPTHAAVSETVSLARASLSRGLSGFVNGVLRAVSGRDLGEWLDEIAQRADPEGTDEVARLAVTESHPEWIVRAVRGALLAHGRPAGELEAALAADNDSPAVTLAARPGLLTQQDLASEVASASGRTAEPGALSPTALRLSGGDPGALPSVRSGAAGVQDEGSQLVAHALVAAPTTGAPTGTWLDLCAGPGGKSALLAGHAGAVPARLVAVEVAPHRAGLVEQSVAGYPRDLVEIRTGDGRELPLEEHGSYDRVLVDVPCTGLGALRRRPESRWRRRPSDLAQLGVLQRELLLAAIDLTRPGGVVAYVTCSPHVAETVSVITDARRRRPEVEPIDAQEVLRSVAVSPAGDLGQAPYVQLWPHLHGTDAMFLALLRKG